MKAVVQVEAQTDGWEQGACYSILAGLPRWLARHEPVLVNGTTTVGTCLPVS